MSDDDTKQLYYTIGHRSHYIRWLIVDGEILHREDGPALIEFINPTMIYSENNFDDILIEHVHKMSHYENDRLHRVAAPAMFFPNEVKFNRYWHMGIEVTAKVQRWSSDHNIDLNNMTEEDRIMLNLYWETFL